MSEYGFMPCRGHCKVCGRPAIMEGDGVCYDCLNLRLMNESDGKVDPQSVEFHVASIRRNGGDERKVFDAFPRLPLQRPINFEE